MRLIFLGTRGNTKVRSRLHRMHSSAIVDGGGGRVLIDCGEDWLGRAGRLRPVAILISHAHDDHAAGLKRGAPCGVYASAEAWRAMARWPVEHSLLAPAVGYRITAGSARIFYVPDIAYMPNPAAVLRGVDVYVGDGATLRRSLIRRRGASDPRETALAVAAIARERGISAEVAYDGFRMTVAGA